MDGKFQRSYTTIHKLKTQYLQYLHIYAELLIGYIRFRRATTMLFSSWNRWESFLTHTPLCVFINIYKGMSIYYVVGSDSQDPNNK